METIEQPKASFSDDEKSPANQPKTVAKSESNVSIKSSSDLNSSKKQFSDFDFGETLGEGSYSTAS
jgi:hypothetical protein